MADRDPVDDDEVLTDGDMPAEEARANEMPILGADEALANELTFQEEEAKEGAELLFALRSFSLAKESSEEAYERLNAARAEVARLLAWHGLDGTVVR
jgi:hypothetical protein